MRPHQTWMWLLRLQEWFGVSVDWILTRGSEFPVGHSLTSGFVKLIAIARKVAVGASILDGGSSLSTRALSEPEEDANRTL